MSESGDAPAIDGLLPPIYEQLRAIARRQMRSEREDHTLQPTALVHEAYLRLVGERRIPWRNRRHFYVAAAEAMRRILLDHAKGRGRKKRGGDRKRQPLNVLDLAAAESPEDLLALDEAVRRLEEERPEVAAVVKLRFFAGLEVAETAESLGISARTVNRHWEFARAWLYRELGGDPEPE